MYFDMFGRGLLCDINWLEGTVVSFGIVLSLKLTLKSTVIEAEAFSGESQQMAGRHLPVKVQESMLSYVVYSYDSVPRIAPTSRK